MFKYILAISAALSFVACSESMTDTRDGKKYNIVKIGNQTWMAENLNYQTLDSYCPEGDARNCDKLGSLYKHNAALTACPENWHLPTKQEFEELIATVGGIENAGAALKSSSGWYKKGNGTDAFDFTGLPAGYMKNNGKFDGIGGYAHFWSANTDEAEPSFAYFLELDFSLNKASMRSYDIYEARSIRCVQN